MARDDDGREPDETTVIAGGQQAWSDLDQPVSGLPGPDLTSADGDQADAPPPFDPPTEVLPIADPVPPDGVEPADPDLGDAPAFSPEGGEIEQSEPGDPSAPAGPQPPKEPPGPVLIANGLGLLTKAGWVFKDIDITLRPASVAAVVGPSGTGRSCLLLALSGRMATNTGSLVVAGHSMRDKPAAIRAVTAVARVGSLAVPEPAFTVRESINERCLLEDVDARVGLARYQEACDALQFTVDPTALVSSLIGDQATLFALALACVRVSALIVLDDLDRGVSAAVQQTLLDALIRLAKTGPTIVVSTTDRIPVMEADVVLDLTPQDGAMVWHFESTGTAGVLEQLDPNGEQRSPVPPAIGPGPLYAPTPEPDPDRTDEQDANPDAPTEDLR
jgi:ABC-type branched-subunit amino acid transport system ATPase component